MTTTRFLTLVLFWVTTAVGARTSSPNVVFILADDLGYGDLGCFGQKVIQTPNLDRMAKEGMKLTRHYAGNAVCAPSRCVLMTGMNPGHAVVRNNVGMASKKIVNGRPETEGQYPIPAETVTMGEVFQSAGYKTGGFGKWGLGGPDSTGAPLKQGFDRWFGYNCQAVAHNFYPTYLWNDAEVKWLNNPAFSAHDELRPDEDPADPASYNRFKGNEYSADLIAEAALQFIRDHQAGPFFLYWPTTVPHVALQVPDEELKAYEGAFEDPPYPGGKGYIPHFKPKAAYAAMITRMDREIGRAMDLIAELGLDENTIFVFSSDNGPLTGTHQGLAGTDCAYFESSGGLRDGKGTLYEGGIRVPGIVRWKGVVPAGTTSDRVTGFEDWMATLADLAGIPAKDVPPGDGIDFAETLRGHDQAERPYLYREFVGYGGQRCLYSGKWKLIQGNLIPSKKKWAGSGELELYDMEKDPKEERNVAAEHPEVVEKLSAMMRSARQPAVDFAIPVLDRES